MEDNSLIIIPTYNESENIELIINKQIQNYKFDHMQNRIIKN